MWRRRPAACAADARVAADLRDIVPRRLGLLRFLQRHPQHFHVFDLRHAGNVHMQRPGAVLPAGALRRSVSRREVLLLVVRHLEGAAAAARTMPRGHRRPSDDEPLGDGGDANSLVGGRDSLSSVLAALPVGTRRNLDRVSHLVSVLRLLPRCFALHLDAGPRGPEATLLRRPTNAELEALGDNDDDDDGGR